MLLAMKDEAGEQPQNEENDFYVALHMEKDLDELTASVQVHASFKVYEQVSHGKRNTIIQTTDCDQIDSSIMFDDLFVENNGGTYEHDSTSHDEYREIQMLAYNLEKKAFKEREDRYLDDILDLEEKLSSHDRIIYKIGQSIQTIHMLGKKPNKVYDPFFKAGLGYTNPERLKLNALYETFVPQQELSAEHIYFLIPFTSDNGSKSKDVPSESPGPKMPTESRSLYKTLSEIKEELIEEVQEMLNIFVPMEQKFNEKPPTENILQNEIDRLLEASLTSEIQNCVLLSVEQQKHELLKVELEKSASDSRDIQANLLKRIKILENNFQRSQAQSIAFELKLQHQKEKMDCDVSWKASCVGSSNSVRRLKSKDNKSKNNVLKNTKSSSTYVVKTTNSVYLYSNKCGTKPSNVCQTNECITNSKTVNAVNDGDPACDVDFRFGNDHFAAIIGYVDYVQGNLTICHVYYVEGLGHNLFSVGQFCDGDLEVAF
ncbi:hypothetical protein Tco_0504749 [Tanacetum coccineum]